MTYCILEEVSYFVAVEFTRTPCCNYIPKGAMVEIKMGPGLWTEWFLFWLMLHCISILSLVIFHFFNTVKVHGSNLSENCLAFHFFVMSTEKDKLAVSGLILQTFFCTCGCPNPHKINCHKDTRNPKTFGAGRGLKAFRGHGCHFSWIPQDMCLLDSTRCLRPGLNCYR